MKWPQSFADTAILLRFLDGFPSPFRTDAEIRRDEGFKGGGPGSNAGMSAVFDSLYE